MASSINSPHSVELLTYPPHPGYVITEIPSNILLKILRPSRYIPYVDSSKVARCHMLDRSHCIGQRCHAGMGTRHDLYGRRRKCERGIE